MCDAVGMGTYFKPLRRKIGVITLFVACVFAVGWMRSPRIIDSIRFPAQMHAKESLVSVTIDSLISSSHSIFWVRSDEGSADISPTEEIDLGPRYPKWNTSSGHPELFHSQFKWRWRVCGFGVGDIDTEPDVGFRETCAMIPYWSIVIPLTVLSAWLLLSKSRKLKKPAAVEC